MNIFEDFEFTEKDIIYADDPEIRVLELLSEYADSPKKYSNPFLDSCCKCLENTGSLSGNQINKLIEIYYRIRYAC